MNKRRGATLVEFIVVATILGIILVLGIQAFFSVAKTNANATVLPPIQRDAIDIVNTIEGSIRRSALCTSLGTVDAAVQAGTANSISVCTPIDLTNQTVVTTYLKYSIDGSGNLIQSSGTLPVGGSTTNATLIAGTVTLAFQYCLSLSSTYSVNDYLDNTASHPSFSWVSGTLTTAQTKQVIAVKVSATITRAGTTVSYSSTVRMRNSPKHTLS